MRWILRLPFQLIAALVWLIRALLGALLWLLATRLVVAGGIAAILVGLIQTRQFEAGPFLGVCIVLGALHLFARLSYRFILPKRQLRTPKAPAPSRAFSEPKAVSPARPKADVQSQAPGSPPFPAFSQVRQLIRPMPPGTSPSEAVARERLSPVIRALMQPPPPALNIPPRAMTEFGG